MLSWSGAHRFANDLHPPPFSAHLPTNRSQSLIPVVMAGIIAVYGLVVSVLIIGGLSPDQPYSLYAGFIHLAAGLSCGLTGLAAGHAIGIVGDAVSFALSQCDVR